MDSEHIYVAAHSLGGVMSQNYLKDGESEVKGLILMGSVILRSNRYLDDKGQTVVNVKTNTLTILGTKDGLLRISRGAEALYTQHNNMAPNQSFTHSLYAIEGTSHASFMD